MTEGKLNLLLGFHGHTSSNINTNNDSIKNLMTLLDILNNFQSLKSTFHLSGNLIAYLDKNTKDFSPAIRNLLDKNKIELLSGGRYEPIFPFIPKEDRQSQIMLMNRLLNHTYGYTPCGAWITEYAWEQSLAIDLSKSKIQYFCITKDYFTSMGLEEKEISPYYLTEEEGRKVAVFPISCKLDDLIKLYSPEEAISCLTSSINGNSQAKVVFYDGDIEDSSKLKWIKTFLEKLDINQDKIETKLLNEYFFHNKPIGRIYLPTISTERDHLIPSKYYLLKYPEANLLHKKMLRVSKKINSANEGKSRFKAIKNMISQAQELLLKGQTCSIYRNSQTAGIYQAEDRENIYSTLIKAETLIETASRQSSKWVQVSEIDYDCDGHDEIIIETETQNIYISPELGGVVLEHDFKSKNINLINTMSQRKEYLKSNFIEHFLEDDISLEKLSLNNINHLTKEIIFPYRVEKIKAKEETSKIALIYKTNLTKLSQSPEIDLVKQFNTRAGDGLLILDYTLTNKSQDVIDFTFGIEFNLNFFQSYDEKNFCYLGGNAKNKTSDSSLKAKEEIKNINQISLRNELLGMDLTLFWNKPSTLYRYPIETIMPNEDKLCQGLTIFLAWRIKLEPDIPWELVIKQQVEIKSEEI